MKDGLFRGVVLFHLVALFYSTIFYGEYIQKETRPLKNLKHRHQKDLARANQLLKILLPEREYIVLPFGVREKETDALIMDFRISKEIGRLIVTINEEDLSFDICCTSVTSYNAEEGVVENHDFVSSVFMFNPEQLALVKELKSLIEKNFHEYKHND